jgi:hypothetical protein
MMASELVTLNTSNTGSTLIAPSLEGARHLEVELIDALHERGAGGSRYRMSDVCPKTSAGMMICRAGHGAAQLAG